MIIRDFKISDLDFVVNIQFDSFDDPYPIGLLLDLYKHGAGFLVAQVGRIVVGYVIFWVSDDIGHIIAIAVDSRFRDMNVGSLLLEKVKYILKRNSIKVINLEVRKSNFDAIRFYINHGFSVVDEIEEYYSDFEDGVIMQYNNSYN